MEYSEFKQKTLKQIEVEALDDEIKDEKVPNKEEVDVHITGIFTEDDLDEITLKESIVISNSSLSVDGLKRGDTIYLTAIFSPGKGMGVSYNNIGVIEVRVVDMYRGMSKLNSIRAKAERDKLEKANKNVKKSRK